MCACSNLLKSIASAFSVPVLAATLSFVAYTSTSHAFNVATIFSSLALFNLLRQPLMFMPRALSATTDAQNALERLKALFLAELNEGEAFIVNPDQPAGLLVEDATFEWEESPSAREIKEGDGKKGNKKEKAAVKGDVTPVPEQSAPFQVKEVNMSIQRGTLAAVVGSVGSGKVRTQPVCCTHRSGFDAAGSRVFCKALSERCAKFAGMCRSAARSHIVPRRLGYRTLRWYGPCELPSRECAYRPLQKENVLFGQPYEEERVSTGYTSMLIAD